MALTLAKGTTFVNVYLPDALKEALHQKAQSRRRPVSMSALAGEYIMQGLQRDEETLKAFVEKAKAHPEAALMRLWRETFRDEDED